MNSPKIDSPVVLISRTAARRLFDETQRWVNHGLCQTGNPFESLCYPLSAMVPKNECLSPLETTCLPHIKELVIDDIAVPPDQIKVFSETNCHFDTQDWNASNEDFNRQIDKLLMAKPRLSVLSKLHVHPFVGGAFLSNGDRYHGITSPKAISWRQRRGLGTSIMHVVYPDTPPTEDPKPWRIKSFGALSRSRKPGSRKYNMTTWRIRSWASNPDGSLVDLGDARIVGKTYHGVRAIKRNPYWARRNGSNWCDTQKKKLKAAGYGVSRNFLGRGWRRYLISNKKESFVFTIPPDFPKVNLRVLRIQRAWRNDFEIMDLPDFALKSRLSQISLLEIAQYFGAAI